MKITIAKRTIWQRLKAWLLRKKVKTSFRIVLKKMVLKDRLRSVLRVDRG